MSRVFERKERGKGRWWIEWRDAYGRKRRKCIGPDRRQALDALKVIEGKVAHLKGRPNRPTDDMPFIDMVRLYSESILPTLGWHEHVRAILTELMATFGTRRLSELTPRDVEAYRAARLSRLKPATINRHVAVLRRLYNVAIDWQLVEYNPVARVKQLRENNARQRWLTAEESVRLVAEVPAHVKPFVLLALNLGARKGELLNLRWRDVNASSKTIAFVQTKSGRRRDVAMNQIVVDTLQALKREGEFVLMRDGRRLGNFSKAFQSACRRAGIEPGFRIHDLRHTHAAASVMAGTDLPTLQRRLGHASIAMTLRYSHLASEHERKSVDAVTLGVAPEVREGVVAFRNTVSRSRQN